MILKASLETHVRRLLERPDNRNRDYIEHHYNKFHFELKSIFSALAGIEEISIADEKEQSAIKESFKLKIGRKKEDLIFIELKSTDSSYVFDTNNLIN